MNARELDHELRLIPPHQLAIWYQLMLGGTDKEIAARTGLALCTVKNYLYSLYAALDLHGPGLCRTRAVTMAIKVQYQHPELFRPCQERDAS